MRNLTWIPMLLVFSVVAICFATAASAEIINVDSRAVLFYDGFENQPANKVSHKLYPDAIDAAPVGTGGAGGSYFIEQDEAMLNAQVTDHVGTPDPGAYTGNNYLRCSRYEAGTTCTVSQVLADNQAVGTHLHLTEMVYVSNTINYTASIQLWSQDMTGRVLTVATYGSRAVQYYQGTWFKTIAGLSYKPNTWQKWEIDYVVGSDTFSLAIDGTSISNIPVFSSTTLVGCVRLCGGMPNQTPVYFDEARVIPEPSTAALLACSLFGLLAYAWRKRR